MLQIPSFAIFLTGTSLRCSGIVPADGRVGRVGHVPQGHELVGHEVPFELDPPLAVETVDQLGSTVMFQVSRYSSSMSTLSDS